jgi:tetratricopeptide (TPR) repeat protein
MEANEFEKANQYFRQIIDSNIPIPPEMPYYFAETLFQLKQFDNSANFLNKYLEINGFKGDNYEFAKDLEERLKEPLNEIRSCQLCDRRGYEYKTCFTCEGTKVIEQDCNYCKAKGIVGCSRCAGSGLVTKKNVFNIIEYFECERCSGNGRLTCPTCKGTKLEVSACKTCQGAGRLNSEKICDHQGQPDISLNSRHSH